jgi:hypothetical protein
MDIAVLTAIISGVVAISAGYLGALWGGRNEHRQWLRNEKHKAYANFAEDTGIADFGAALDGSLVAAESIARQRAAMHRLQLFAPEHIYEAAIKAVESAKVFSRALRDGAPTDGLQDEYAARMLELSYAMRIDLHSRQRGIGRNARTISLQPEAYP